MIPEIFPKEGEWGDQKKISLGTGNKIFQNFNGGRATY